MNLSKKSVDKELFLEVLKKKIHKNICNLS